MILSSAPLTYARKHPGADSGPQRHPTSPELDKSGAHSHSPSPLARRRSFCGNEAVHAQKNDFVAAQMSKLGVQSRGAKPQTIEGGVGSPGGGARRNSLLPGGATLEEGGSKERRTSMSMIRRHSLQPDLEAARNLSRRMSMM
jgi:hypothetical protein